MCSTLTRLPLSSIIRLEAFCAALGALPALHVVDPASSLLLLLLSHKSNEASFLVLRVCAALLPLVSFASTALPEHSPTIDATVGFGLPSRERRLGYESVDILFVADSPRFVAYITVLKNEHTSIVARWGLMCQFSSALGEDPRRKRPPPFLFRS